MGEQAMTVAIEGWQFCILIGFQSATWIAVLLK